MLEIILEEEHINTLIDILNLNIDYLERQIGNWDSTPIETAITEYLYKLRNIRAVISRQKNTIEELPFT